MPYREVTYKGQGEKNIQKRLEEIKERGETILFFEIIAY